MSNTENAWPTLPEGGVSDIPELDLIDQPILESEQSRRGDLARG